MTQTDGTRTYPVQGEETVLEGAPETAVQLRVHFPWEQHVLLQAAAAFGWRQLLPNTAAAAQWRQLLLLQTDGPELRFMLRRFPNEMSRIK
jgi:hypothetical protein